jgi:hypothetical protein
MAKKLLLRTVILRDSYTFLYAFSCIRKYTNKDAMKFTRCGLFASHGQLVLTLIIATWIQLFSAFCDERGLDGQLLFTLIIAMDPTFLCLLLSTRTRSLDKRSNQSFSFADNKESKRHASRLHNFMYPENVLLRQSLGASIE